MSGPGGNGASPAAGDWDPDDEICTACSEPRSAHVATDKGPFTHPKEARGEGTYVRNSGTSFHGLDCRLCHGPCDGHTWESWAFVPSVVAPPDACPRCGRTECVCPGDYEDEDDGFDPNTCPGCGGNCQTACR